MASIFDELKDGLSSLLDKVAGNDDGPVPTLTPAQIRSALEARAKGRPAPTKLHSIAKRAGSTDEARKERERAAKTRETRIHKHRADRQRAQQAAQAEAFEEAKRRAYGGSTASASSGSSSGSSKRSGPRMPSFRKNNEMAKHYETLNLTNDADFAEVKKAFRALMRRYHPDMHSGSPDKQKAASELTKQLTVAYNELERHLTDD